MREREGGRSFVLGGRETGTAAARKHDARVRGGGAEGGCSWPRAGGACPARVMALPASPSGSGLEGPAGQARIKANPTGSTRSGVRPGPASAPCSELEGLAVDVEAVLRRRDQRLPLPPSPRPARAPPRSTPVACVFARNKAHATPEAGPRGGRRAAGRPVCPGRRQREGQRAGRGAGTRLRKGRQRPSKSSGPYSLEWPLI